MSVNATYIQISLKFVKILKSMFQSRYFLRNQLKIEPHRPNRDSPGRIQPEPTSSKPFSKTLQKSDY